jgi:deoxyribonuclease-4
MIEIGIAGIPLTLKGKGTGEGIKYLSRIGLDAMEVQFVRRVSMKEKTACEVSQVAREYNIALSVHAPYMINLASENPTIIVESLERIKLSVARAWALGASIVVFHSAYYTKKYTRDETYEFVKTGCSEVLDYMEDNGYGEIKLGVEIMGRQSQFGTVDELYRLKKEIRGVVPAVDFAHLNARCNGCMNAVEDYSSVLLKLFNKDDLVHIHFSGIEFSNGNEKRHLPVDFNQFALLMSALEKTRCDARIICESPLLEQDALKMKALVVKTSKS